MGTRGEAEQELLKENEEKRWSQLYPEIKKCAVGIVRIGLNKLNTLKLKRETDSGTREEEEDEEEEGGRARSRDAEPSCDWMQQLEQDDNDGDVQFRSFLKKVVKVKANQTPAIGNKKPHSRCREPSLLRHQSADVTPDPVHLRCQQKKAKLCRRIRRSNKEANKVKTKSNDNQSQDAKEEGAEPNQQFGSLTSNKKDKDRDSCSTEKKENLPTLVLRKVGEDQWVLRRPKVKEVEEEKCSIITKQRRRRLACDMCASCIRPDCGKCSYCQDKIKFGGPNKLRQKCRHRVCLWMTGEKVGSPSLENIWDKDMETGQDRKEEEVKKRKQQKTAGSEDEGWTGPLSRTKEEEEEEPKEEEGPGHIQFALVEENLLPEGLSAGTHIQLDFTLDSSHFTPTMLSDSTLTIDSQSELQEVYLLHDASPPPPSYLQPLLLQPNEEEIVYFTTSAAEGELGEGGWSVEEVEVFSEDVLDKGRHYGTEVELLGSGSDDEMPAPCLSSSEVTDDVTAPDPAYEPPELISLSSESFRLLGGGASDEVTRGHGLLRLLLVLREMVLPDHWVPVLSGAPLLHLLQCSQLSSMTDTIVHIRPNHCFYISVQKRLVPGTHTLYHRHSQRITHIGQLVSLLFALESHIVCRGSRVRSSNCQLEVQSPTCHLLVAPPCVTCLPCLLWDEKEEDDNE